MKSTRKKKGVFFFAVAVMLTSLTVPIQAKEDPASPVAINDANFPDKALQGYVKGTTINKDGDDELSIQELKDVESLRLSGLGITNLAGIEYFINCDTIDCSKNDLGTVNFSAMKNLMFLKCDNSNISSLNLTGLTKLETVACNSNQISTLTIENNPNLWEVDCSTNALTELNINTGNPALKHVKCDNNQLTSLVIEDKSNLETIAASNNLLSVLSIKNLPSLVNLEVSNNSLTTLDMAGYKSLKYLLVNNNDLLTTLKLNDLDSLSTLEFTNNKILSTVSLENLPNLTSLSSFKGALTSLTVKNLIALDSIYVQENMLTSLVLEDLPALTQLYVYKNKLMSLDVTSLTALQYLYCYDNELTNLDVTKNTSLINLWCYKNNLTTLDVSNNPELTWFIPSHNNLRSLDVSKNTKLTKLDVRNNDLLFLNVGTNTAVKPELSDQGMFNIKLEERYIDLSEEFPDIKGDNISNVKGASLKVGTSILENITMNELITYSYDIGNGTFMEVSIVPYGINRWEEALSIKDVVYGDAVAPKAQSLFGDVTYLYSKDKETGYTSDKPTELGTYYVKAIVEETEFYSGLESIVEFKIEKQGTEITDNTTKPNKKEEAKDVDTSDRAGLTGYSVCFGVSLLGVVLILKKKALR